LEINKLKINCENGKIKNPKTGKCVNQTGAIGKEIINNITEKSTIKIENFLSELILNTDVFLDLYFEFPMYKNQDYQSNIWDVKYNHGNDNNKKNRLANLLYTFYNCMVYSKRSVDKCKLGRVHYLDVRKGDISPEEMNDISWFRQKFKSLDTKKITKFLNKPRAIKILTKFSSKTNNKDFITYWEDQVLQNKYNRKELDKSYMGDIILKFIKQRLVNIVFERRNLFSENTDKIFNTKDVNVQFKHLENIYNLVVTPNGIITDAYALARMFKKFNTKNKSSLYSHFDQPEEPHNIIIYAGDLHSTTYRTFLKQLNFKQVAFIKREKSRNCISLKNFPQPFFSHNYYKNISKPLQIKGLKWYGNSCYLDSSLVALFAQPTSFTTNILNLNLKNYPLEKQLICGKTYEEDLKNKEKVQEQLRIVVDYIRGKESDVDQCFDLRETFKNCPNIENYYNTEMKDAGDFLGYLLSLFPVNTARIKTITYTTNSLEDPPKQNDLIQTSVIYDNRASVMFTVDSFQLNANPKLKISKYLQNTEDSILTSTNLFYPYGKNKPGYIRRIYNRKLENAPYIILNFKRLNPLDNSFILSKVIPEEQIKLPSGQTFNLSSIVLFENAHYTCVFKVNDTWYHYNDMGGNGTAYNIKKIGTGLSKMLLKTKPDPQTNGTLYFYKPI
jgi:hypothetical protein